VKITYIGWVASLDVVLPTRPLGHTANRR